MANVLHKPVAKEEDEQQQRHTAMVVAVVHTRSPAVAADEDIHHLPLYCCSSLGLTWLMLLLSVLPVCFLLSFVEYKTMTITTAGFFQRFYLYRGRDTGQGFWEE